jgi:hypothetical protein
MSVFKTTLQEALRGKLSLEASEVVIPPPSHELTVEDVQEAREERSEMAEALHEVQTNNSAKDMEAGAAVVTAIGAAAKAAEDMPAAAADAFVATANMNIATAEQVLETTIPKLAMGSDGGVDEVSLESLSDWFGSAVKAFSAAAARTGGRLALSFVRLNQSTVGLQNRTRRVRDKVRSRKGSGGVDIRLPQKVLELLVNGSNYSQAPTHDLTAFATTSRTLTDIVMEYHRRCDHAVKTHLVQAISAQDLPHDLFAGIQQDDLFQRLDAVIKAQPLPLLGNVKYARNEERMGRLMAFHLQQDGTLATDVVKYTDQIKSLSTETILQYCQELDRVIGEQIRLLEKVSDAVKVSYASVGVTIKKLTNMSTDDVEVEYDYELDSDINTADLLRLESQLVSEIGRICDRLSRLQADLLARLDAVLTLVEESVFQD